MTNLKGYTLKNKVMRKKGGKLKRRKVRVSWKRLKRKLKKKKEVNQVRKKQSISQKENDGRKRTGRMKIKAKGKQKKDRKKML